MNLADDVRMASVHNTSSADAADLGTSRYSRFLGKISQTSSQSDLDDLYRANLERKYDKEIKGVRCTKTVLVIL